MYAFVLEKDTAMTFALKELRVDDKDSKLLHLTLVNVGFFPTVFTVTASVANLRSQILLSDMDDRENWAGLRAHRPSVGIKVFMVTRRSTVNPDEVVKLRVKLMAPATDFHHRAQLQLIICGEVKRFDLPTAGA